MFSDHENPPPLFTFQDSSLFDETKSPAVLPWINTKAANMYEGKDVDIIPRAPSMNIRKFRNIPGAIPRRRAGKKDRHSKICTAHGIRDRRMRLSLQIARKFFDLQDMLGYDKASKTIEWLFAKSKKAIKELIKDHPEYYYDDDDEDDDDDAKSDSFISECEVVSPNPSKREERESMKGGSKRIDLRSESRERARARARWRTREKMMIKILEGSGNYNMSCKSSNPSYDKYCFDHKLLGFSNGPIFEGVDLPGSSLNDQERVSLSGSIYGDVGTIEKFLGNSSMSCPDSEYQNRGASDYNVDPNCEFMGFFGSWDMLNNERGSSIPYAVANDQVSLGENPSSVYSATP